MTLTKRGDQTKAKGKSSMSHPFLSLFARLFLLVPLSLCLCWSPCVFSFVCDLVLALSVCLFLDGCLPLPPHVCLFGFYRFCLSLSVFLTLPAHLPFFVYFCLSVRLTPSASVPVSVSISVFSAVRPRLRLPAIYIYIL